jgi:hypothetical protein
VCLAAERAWQGILAAGRGAARLPFMHAWRSQNFLVTTESGDTTFNVTLDKQIMLLKSLEAFLKGLN